MWQYAVDRVIACLWIFQTFTSCVLMAKGGYIQVRRAARAAQR